MSDHRIQRDGSERRRTGRPTGRIDPSVRLWIAAAELGLPHDLPPLWGDDLAVGPQLDD
jgi:hypothetical protein